MGSGWRRAASTALASALVALTARTAAAKIIYVDQVNGSDDASGQTAEEAVATISKAATLAEGGDEVIIGAGTYYEQPEFWNLGSSAEAPVWIHAESCGDVTISAMWEEAARGMVDWEPEGDGVYSAAHGASLYAAYEGSFLFRFNTVQDLLAGSVVTYDEYKADKAVVATPNHGFVWHEGRIYVRLPNGQDPNGEAIDFSTPSWGEPGTVQGVVSVTKSSHVILDGLRIEGSGTSCVWFEPDSVSPTVRNTVLSYCTIGLRLPNDSLVEWSEYAYPGFHEFADQILDLNPTTGLDALYDLVKNYHVVAADLELPEEEKKRRVWMEGGLATSYGEAGISRDCEFHHNYMHEAFDGEALGAFEYSESHHNVYMYNYDNHVEFEYFTAPGDAGSRELRLHHSLMLAGSQGPISHQQDNIVGPHYVYNNVIHGFDDHGWDSWTQIKSNAPAAEGLFYYHNLIWGRDGRLMWVPHDSFEFRNNIIVFESNEEGSIDGLNSDYNLIVNEVDLPWMRGPNGSYVGQDPAALGFLDVAALDFGIAEGSPAENAGVGLPGYNDDAPGGPDIGPFEAGVEPGADWPRPRQTVCNCEPPARWNGPVPEQPCGSLDVGGPDPEGETDDGETDDGETDEGSGSEGTDGEGDPETDDPCDACEEGGTGSGAGCGCSTRGAAGSMLWLGLIGLARRRRRIQGMRACEADGHRPR